MIIEDYRSTDYEKIQGQIADFVATTFDQISKTSEVIVDSSDPYWQAIRFCNIEQQFGLKDWYEKYLETRGVFPEKIPDKSFQIQNGEFVEIDPLTSHETSFGFIFMVMD